MKRVILIGIMITGMLLAKSGTDVVEIRRIDWARINLTAIYNGYFTGNKDAYLQVFSLKDKNTLKIVLYIREGADKGYYMGEAKKVLSQERENMNAYWLNFIYESRMLK